MNSQNNAWEEEYVRKLSEAVDIISEAVDWLKEQVVESDEENFITRAEIQEYIDTYIRKYLGDTDWHICLVEAFMCLLKGDSFNVANLQDMRWVRTVIENNKDNKYAEKMLMQETPEVYISALFTLIVMKRNKDRKKQAAVALRSV